MSRYERYRELAALLPELRTAGPNDVATCDPEAPGWDYHGPLASFIHQAYDTEFMDPDFRWTEHTKWVSRMHDDPERIRRLGLPELRGLTTAIVRDDRFAPGAVAEAFRTGVIVAILERLEQILSTT